MSTQCLFHGERIYFEDIKKALRRAALIPRYLSPCLAMAVCSCRKKVPVLPYSESEITNTVQYLKNNVDNVIQDAGLRTVILRLCNWDMRVLDKSYLKLLFIMHQGLDKDFTLLTNEQKIRPDEPRKGVKRTGHIKVTPRAAMQILKKRMTRMSVKRKFLIPMFAGSMKLLFEKTGVNFCKFSKKHGCVVRLNNEANTENIKKKIRKTSVSVGCQDETTFSVVQKELSSLAAEIQRTQDEKWNKTLELRRHMKSVRKQYSLACQHEEYMYDEAEGLDKLGIDSLDFKKINCYNCDRKRQNDNKNRGKKKGQPNQTLVGGHCLYCLQPYSRTAKNETGGMCIHHPGYIVYTLYGLTWSCCDERAPEYPSHEKHADTGCTTGKHEWKPHKRANRKPDLWKHSQIIDSPMSKINRMHCLSAKDALYEVNSFYLENYR